MNKEVQIAKILRPHGLKGTLKISPLYDDIPFSKLDLVTVGMHSERMHVEHVQPMHQFYLIQFKEITSIEQAEFYRNQGIYVDRSMYPEIFENLVLSSDYIGCEVFDENNKKIGVVIDYDDFGSAPIISINCGGTTYMVPFIEDTLQYVREREIFIIDSKRFLETRVWE